MAQGRDWILTLNAGSSSLKFAAYDSSGKKRLVQGQVAAIGDSAKLLLEGGEERVDAQNHHAALERALDFLRAHAIEGEPLAAGHRVVHGGIRNSATLLTPDVRGDIERAAELAPLHNPPALKVMDALNSHYKGLPQVVCFDTAFHADNPKEATTIAIPAEYRNRGIRRYGFHGLSYASLVRHFSEVTGELLPRRVLALHLGAGSSLCAIVDGKGVATSMGFSPMDGLVMATRSGAIDPGVLLHLMRAE
ncbi:MAG TPA: acetate kinase, partial [Devosia sp.]|nr:acetate kinase [Devosia sp.]